MSVEDNKDIDEVLLKIIHQQSVFKKEALRQELIFYINHLLVNNFSRLLSLLYRVDVDEKKLKNLLQEHPQTDAAILIADLLIQRLKEKQEARSMFKSDDSIPEDEKW